MKRRDVLFISLMFLLALSLPVMAQDDAPQEAIPVSGTFAYTWEMHQMATTMPYIVQDASESEVWTGDLEGTAEAIFRIINSNAYPSLEVWLITDGQIN